VNSNPASDKPNVKLKKNSNPKLTFRVLLRSPVAFLGFGLGAGLLPKGPGTWGTLIGWGLFIPLMLQWPALAWGLAIIGTVLSGWICGRSADWIGVHDHGGIVWDEFVAIWWVLLLLPQQGWVFWGLAFVVFRLFDILKPWPIKQLDAQLKGGWGIVLDDLLAAVYTLGVIWGFALIFVEIG